MLSTLKNKFPQDVSTKPNSLDRGINSEEFISREHDIVAQSTQSFEESPFLRNQGFKDRSNMFKKIII